MGSTASTSSPSSASTSEKFSLYGNENNSPPTTSPPPAAIRITKNADTPESFNVVHVTDSVIDRLHHQRRLPLSDGGQQGGGGGEIPLKVIMFVFTYYL